ncbi:hypothetical protein JW721_02455 [Candidatus Micrarchaeota archaeon]|nr:hypothetical protein [Candidatus Micrarchaeota archaeon]
MEGQKRDTTLAVVVFGFMGIAFVGMLGLLLALVFFGGGSSPQDGYLPDGTGDSQDAQDDSGDSGSATAVDLDMTERVNAIAQRIEGIDGINNGAKFGLIIGEDEGYTIGKISSGIFVLDGVDEGTDFDIYMDSPESFEEIENAQDVCAKMRELRNAGKITAVMHASDMQLFFKGYLAMEPCLK